MFQVLPAGLIGRLPQWVNQDERLNKAIHRISKTPEEELRRIETHFQGIVPDDYLYYWMEKFYLAFRNHY